jgi:DNA repair protein RadC
MILEQKNIHLKKKETFPHTVSKVRVAVRGILAEIASFSIKYGPEIIFVDKKPRKNIKALFETGNLPEVSNF